MCRNRLTTAKVARDVSALIDEWHEYRENLIAVIDQLPDLAQLIPNKERIPKTWQAKIESMLKPLKEEIAVLERKVKSLETQVSRLQQQKDSR